jgi:antitoxin component YwqK of YwqJK toxin-antitoxin module
VPAALAVLAVLVASLLIVGRRSPPPLSEVAREALALRDGRLYRLGATTPFTGVVTERHGDGALRSRSGVVDGRLHGVSESWHTNGQMQAREHFSAGVSHGPRIKWHPNGQTLSEATIIEGRIEGVFRRWHEDGALAEEIPMKAGQPDGLSRAYYPSGFLKAEARLRNGQVVEQRFWKDGERAGPALAATGSRSATGH